MCATPNNPWFLDTSIVWGYKSVSLMQFEVIAIVLSITDFAILGLQVCYLCLLNRNLKETLGIWHCGMHMLPHWTYVMVWEYHSSCRTLSWAGDAVYQSMPGSYIIFIQCETCWYLCTVFYSMKADVYEPSPLS